METERDEITKLIDQAEKVIKRPEPKDEEKQE